MTFTKFNDIIFLAQERRKIVQYEIEYQYGDREGVCGGDRTGKIRFETESDDDALSKVKLLLDREKILQQYSIIWQWELKKIVTTSRRRGF